MEDKCPVCNGDVEITPYPGGGYSLPMYGGKVNWASKVAFSVCKKCYDDNTIGDGNKYIHFCRCGQNGITEVWDVINTKSEEPLAQIKWYSAWRQYVIIPEPETVYNDGCLEVITGFIKRLNVKQKTNQAAPKG